MSILRTWKKVFENDLDYLAAELREFVERPAVIILSGPVGAGKTTFIKRFLKDIPVQSPTYSIINECGEIAHADFYRLKDPHEVIHLELNLYLENKDFFLVEWGMPFLKEISRAVEENFLFYELEISVNSIFDETKPSSQTRNFILKSLSRL